MSKRLSRSKTAKRILGYTIHTRVGGFFLRVSTECEARRQWAARPLVKGEVLRVTAVIR